MPRDSPAGEVWQAERNFYCKPIEEIQSGLRPRCMQTMDWNVEEFI